jgi:hypothetical protein
MSKIISTIGESYQGHRQDIFVRAAVRPRRRKKSQISKEYN